MEPQAPVGAGARHGCDARPTAWTRCQARSGPLLGVAAEAIRVPIRVGFDLVSVASVEDELSAPTRDRYLARVYTEREVAECTSDRGVSAERLAGRFAAKEATIKVLPSSNVAFTLREIEVRRAPSGKVEMELSGGAAELARSAGIVELSVSLTHEAGMAGAVVVAEYRQP
jgi:holo-[acyl-carrier protein] synthase